MIKGANDEILYRGYLDDYEKFDACRSFIQREVLAVAYADGVDNDWLEYGSPHSHFGNGTTAHAVDQAREFGCVSPIIQAVSDPLSRGLMITLFDGESANGTMVGEVLKIQFNYDLYGTPWTKGCIDMFYLSIFGMTERDWAAARRLLHIWTHAIGERLQVRDMLYAEMKTPL